MKKLLGISSIIAIVAGFLLIAGGIWGIVFTYANVTQEKITTPSDARIPNKIVADPLTLKAQADVIRKHTLAMTDGKTFAEMPRQIPKLDEIGNPVLDSEGNPMMAPNTARDTWITATTLTTALHLGILTYVFSGLVVLFGLVSVWTGGVFWMLRRKFE